MLRHFRPRLAAPHVGAIALLVAVLPAQQDPVQGTRRGTQSWIVHLQDRPFDLADLRTEMRGDRRPGKVATIVADLERRMRAHQASFVAAVTRLGGRVTSQWWLINACAIEIAPQRLEAVRALANVRRLERDLVFRPAIKAATDGKNHNSDNLNARGLTGSGVTIAILDTGHDEKCGTKNRPHVIYSTRGSTTRPHRLRLNKKIGSQPADDVHGHGTSVTSVAAGYRWMTTAADHGHAFDAGIAGYAIANDATTGASSTQTMANAWQEVVKDAAAHNIRTANLSFGGNNSPTNAAQMAMDNAALVADILNCTAGGNSGSNVSGSQVNVNGLSVGAVTKDAHLLWSGSASSNVDGQVFPDLVANGVGVVMARRDAESSNWVANGTSIASPQVCGAATLLRAARTGLTALETKAVLLASAAAITGTGTNQVTGQGVGYLRDDFAYELASDPARHGTGRVTSTQRTWTRCMPVVKDAEYQVAIAWFRQNVASTTWSNLDLRVKDGSVVVASSLRMRNTEEFIRFKAPKTGILTIEVRATSLAHTQTEEFGWSTTTDIGSSLVDLTASDVDVVETMVVNPTAVTYFEASAFTWNLSCTSVGPSSIGFYLSPDSVITTQDKWIGAINVSGMSAFGVQLARTTIRIPANTKPGTYYIGACADYLGRITESDEKNNCSGPVRVTLTTGSPDLVAGVQVNSGRSTTVLGGDMLKVTAATTNISTDPAGKSTMVIYFYDGYVTYPLLEIPVPALAAKQSFGKVYDVQIPYVAGTTTISEIRVQADAFGRVGEKSESNNLARALNVRARPFTGSDVQLEMFGRGVDPVSRTGRFRASRGLNASFRITANQDRGKIYVLYMQLTGKPLTPDVLTDAMFGLRNTMFFPQWQGTINGRQRPGISFPPTNLPMSLKVYVHAVIINPTTGGLGRNARPQTLIIDP